MGNLLSSCLLPCPPTHPAAPITEAQIGSVRQDTAAAKIERGAQEQHGVHQRIAKQAGRRATSCADPGSGERG